jgi:hypothetical protein
MTNADLIKRLRAEATPFAPHNDPVVMVLRSTLREAADALERAYAAIDKAQRETASDPDNRWCKNATIILDEAMVKHD